MSNAQTSRRLTHVSCETLISLLEALPAALFILDEADTIVSANARAQALLSAAPDALVGTRFWCSAGSLVSTALYRAIHKAKKSQEPAEVEYMAPVTRRWLHVSLSPTEEGLLIVLFHPLESLLHRSASRHNDQRDRNLLESFADGVTILSPDGLVLDINERLLADAHLQREQVMGKAFTDLPAWSYDTAFQEQLRAAIARASQGETARFEARIHPQPNLPLDLVMTMTSHRAANGQVEYLLCVSRDITERKQAEDHLRTLINAIPHFVWIMRPDGSCDYSNQQWCDYTAMTVEQLQGDGWQQILHPDERERVLSVWREAVQTGTLYEVEHRLRHGPTGAYRWFLARGMPLRDSQGTIVRWVGTCTDIDEQKRAEQQLKESEQNFRLLADTVPQLVWTTSPDGQHEYMNQRGRDYTGLTLEQIQSEKWAYLQLIHPDDRERARELWQHALDTGDMYETEHRLKEIRTGRYRWFLARAMPVRDEAGQIIKWFGTATDIDEQKRVEQQLKESREHLRVLAETVPQLVWSLLPDGRIDYVNQRCCELIQAPREHILDYGWCQFVHPEDLEQTLALQCQALETGEPYEMEYRLIDGRTGAYRWFLARGLPVRDEAGQITKWFGTSTDIDERKRMEQALRESQKRTSVLMNSNIIGIFIAEDDQIVDANETFLHMTGYTREDLHAGRINWIQMTPPEDLARTLQAHQEFATRESITPYEKEYVCKDGSRLPVLVGEVLLEHHPRRVIGFVLDNSARKELEQRKDDFISMASHELRNPLTALKLQTQLIRKRLHRQGQKEATTAFSRIEGPIKQLERLIAELLDVSKIQAGRIEYVWEPVDLDALLQEITETMQQSHPSHTIVVRGALQTKLLADRDRLAQVFSNLISNAIKYSPGAQSVEIDLSASAEKVTIQVHDHGIGIPAEQCDKIFERFYRVTDTKPRAISGLGMGLYIVAEILKHHGGTISVQSAIGKGSTFTVTLPKNRAV